MCYGLADLTGEAFGSSDWFPVRKNSLYNEGVGLIHNISCTVCQVEGNKIATDSCFLSSEAETTVSSGRGGVSGTEGVHRQEQTYRYWGRALFLGQQTILIK
jgi:hypothetical protein